MIMDRLITKTDIIKFREISKSTKDEKINPYIDDAQNEDLRPLLGDALFFDLVNNVTDEKYVKLMKGGSYEHNEEEYYFYGLDRVLSIFAHARYVLFGSNTDTPFGYVNKTTQDSSPVSHASKKDTYIKERQTAITYFSDASLFLQRKKEEYPKSRQNCSHRKRGTGFRIYKID